VWSAYDADEKCGFVFTLNGFLALMSLIETVYSTKGWQPNNPALPIFFISGHEDPCRINDKKFLQAVDQMKKAGYTNTEYRLMDNMRHEILNEKDKIQVYNLLSDKIKSFF
jgi:alpha-beta hydrolase superfamily lysophospholipase